MFANVIELSNLIESNGVNLSIDPYTQLHCGISVWLFLLFVIFIYFSYVKPYFI